MAESADALASGASEGNFVGVQVPSSAPRQIAVKASHFSGHFEKESQQNTIVLLSVASSRETQVREDPRENERKTSSASPVK